MSLYKTSLENKLVYKKVKVPWPAETNKGWQSQQKAARRPARAGNELARAGREPAKAGRAAEAEGQRGPAEASSSVFNESKASMGENNVFQKFVFGKI